jgi:outer membrane protein OmpA-like peptidoglycan-associated protein
MYAMKRIILFVFSACIIGSSYSQTIIKKDRYTVSGGILGAVNMSQFRITGNNPDNVDYDSETGWGAGLWVNIPVASWFSLEPQVQYNSLRYDAGNNNTSLLLANGKIRYITVPLLLKFHLGDKFAITAGPQVDFITKVTDRNNVADEKDFNQTSVSAFGGLEIFPHGRVTIFGRYIHGLSTMEKEVGELTTSKYKNQNIQAGLKLKLFGKKIPADSDGDGVADKDDKCPNQAGVARYDGCPVPDTDGDGINDEQDSCVSVFGLAKYNGCPVPDSDGDGINDENDRCPNQPGVAKYNGCPIPDTDGDGLNDEEDRCPNQAGPRDRQGCPVTDRDNDGVADDVDRCPDLAGTAANNGCPEVPANVSKSIGTAAMNIKFGATNATVTSGSNASLNTIVRLMNENPGLKIRVEGHTSNAGDDAKNMTLSTNRAEAVKTFLVNKGISADRIETEGFGETTPIADNGTAAGRAKNNRVEVKIVY